MLCYSISYECVVLFSNTICYVIGYHIISCYIALYQIMALRPHTSSCTLATALMSFLAAARSFRRANKSGGAATLRKTYAGRSQNPGSRNSPVGTG